MQQSKKLPTAIVGCLFSAHCLFLVSPPLNTAPSSTSTPSPAMGVDSTMDSDDKAELGSSRTTGAGVDGSATPVQSENKENTEVQDSGKFSCGRLVIPY